ncbi:sensor histidine kinase [Feifania hominis]|uniref:histidine kinase n=1 Tax=Feifania hominis TaxID=2763660 RepID=A0A926DEQ7_9FIRM|nr:HAMP domain-containing sensor histidine kinase [Feifania hominis]MBC8536487.1 HAMP domain-containing histidine kinase [Feifania hominis]
MKNWSVKLRITVWLLVVMAVMAALLLAFMLTISSAVVAQSARAQLTAVVQSNLGHVDMQQGKLTLGDGFVFHQNGVTTLLYSKNEALLAGQIPVSFAADEPFENGVTRTVQSAAGDYYVLDLWRPVGWDDGVWVRGLLEAPENQSAARNLLRVAVITAPAFVALAALGCWWITRRAFRPLESITAAADAINEARDLSGRINLPPGKDEFSRLAQTFDGMFERLERSFEAEKQFASDASHELRTPVSVILGACEYAEKFDETPEERRETIEMIHRQAKRMSQMIEQLLSMTRMEQGTEKTTLEPTDLTALTRAACAELGYEPERLILELEPDVTARVDSVQMTRLIVNLVTNAFKYGRPGGHAWVALRRDDGEIQLSVRDDGIGIPEGEREKIWQRFYQVDPSRSSEGGAGLGLALVQQIARAHGGHMTLESVTGVGSVFTLHLPE